MISSRTTRFSGQKSMSPEGLELGMHSRPNVWPGITSVYWPLKWSRERENPSKELCLEWNEYINILSVARNQISLWFIELIYGFLLTPTLKSRVWNSQTLRHQNAAHYEAATKINKNISKPKILSKLERDMEMEAPEQQRIPPRRTQNIILVICLFMWCGVDSVYL